jgi:WXG100 family type VII secretion target
MAAGSITVTPEKLRVLGKACNTQAKQIIAVKTNVERAIAAAGWHSEAADKFERDWREHYVKALKNLEAALDSLGGAAEKMAGNYEQNEKTFKGVA